MRSKLTIIFTLLLFFSSCKLIEEETGITEPTEQSATSSVKVISPNGGESLMEGSSFDIKWTATTKSKIRIQVTFDNGASWFLIADSLNNTGIYSWFPVPNSISNQCKIRIATIDGSASSMSSNVFSIVRNSNESLRITSPNGNEEWEAGSSKQIKWYSSGIDSVRIEYTTNNGNTWNLIAVDKKNTGIYFWEPIPKTPSTLAKVRIKDAKDGVPFTESANTFSILPEAMIKVLSPNGLENIDVGSSFRIEWISENIQNVSIAYTADNGYSWTSIVNSTPSIGYYYWNPVPNVNSQLCKIRIADANDGEPKDFSDNVFTIRTSANQTITIKTPNGGENWEAGTTKSITWYSSTGIDSVYLEYTTDNGNTWKYIGKDTKNTGIYFWGPIPNTPSTLAKVRVKDAKDGVPSDESNDVFYILPEPAIKVLTPNGGEVWRSGSNQTIEWISENIANVKLEYTTNNGQQWNVITNSTPSVGFYYWQNIPNHNSNLCKIRVSDADDSQPNDVSDNTFIITNQLIKSINITTPSGGEVWQAGTIETINWTSQGISNVNIEFTSNNGLTWQTIANNVANTGSYPWNIPNISSSQCKIKITDASDNSMSAESRNSFTINPIQSITILAPNGNENIIAGESYTIRWISTGIKNVKIEYTVTNGLTDADWFTIVNSTPAAQGSYNTSFTIPSKQYRIRISDAEDGSPMVSSASTFTVGPKPSITVVAPNGGENWLINERYEIKWESNNISHVKIELTIDGGANWKLIASGITSNGIYNWKVEPSIIDHRSDLCKIRISEFNPSDPNLSRAVDESDKFFSIHPKSKLLRVVKPNGGESWFYNNYNRIEWTSSGISYVKLEYTLNNGMSWYSISDKYPSTGAYDWNPPNIVSSLARIRITDVSDDAGANPETDISDSFFNLTAQEAFITIVKPDGKKELTAGVQDTIIWNNTDEITQVTLEYSVDNGNTWILIGTHNTPEQIRHEFVWTPTVAQVDKTKPYSRIRISSGSVIAISNPFIIK